jgi:hypothetical protein
MLSALRTQGAGFAIDGIAMLETDARYAGYSATAAGNVYEELRRASQHNATQPHVTLLKKTA